MADAPVFIVADDHPLFRDALRRTIESAFAGARIVEAGTLDEVLAEVDAGRVDLVILDGEAQPAGGMGISRQLQNEITNCPPTIVAVRRRDDRWLATWSQADAVIVHPLDPIAAAETVAEVLRAHRLPVSGD